MARLGLAVLAALVLPGCLADGLQGVLPGEDEDERAQQLRGFYATGTEVVRIVVHAHPGYEPLDSTVTALREQTTRLTAKPTEVEVRTEARPAPQGGTWTLTALRPILGDVEAEPWPAATALLHVVALPGCLAYNETRDCIGGVALDSRVAFVMTDAAQGDVVQRYTDQHPAQTRDTPLVGWYTAERFLYVHETGHVLGLVGDLAPEAPRLVREDCFCHSEDVDSVMHRFNRGWNLRLGETVLEDASRDDWQRYTYSAQDVGDAQAFRDALRSRA